MVTISIDKCFFEKPAKEGQLVKIYGVPNKVGSSSITIYMECRAHNVYTGEQRVVLRTHIKFVRIDEDGNPIPISDRAKNRINKLILGEPVVGDTVI
jgi:acyl-CoA thioesterase YciA